MGFGAKGKSMRKLILSGVSIVAIATGIGGASAADVARPIYNAPTAVNYWQGLYVGGTIGLGSMHVFSASTDINLTGYGPVGGLHLGFNHQGASNFVWGVEGDLSAAGLTIRNSDNNYSVDLLGSVRARFGLAFDRVLAYGTVGGALALGKGVSSDGTTPIGYLQDFRLVWGGGAEFAIDDRVS